MEESKQSDYRSLTENTEPYSSPTVIGDPVKGGASGCFIFATVLLVLAVSIQVISIWMFALVDFSEIGRSRGSVNIGAGVVVIAASLFITSSLAIAFAAVYLYSKHAGPSATALLPHKDEDIPNEDAAD